ncbi:hypothetical protein DRJ25_05915, partial [Candidatus Woesearchaeota archaeon]
MEKKEIDIKIGNICNNNCMFCVNERSREISKDFETIIKEIAQARKEGYSKIIITGGEPTIQKDLIKIIKAAKKV